MPSKLYDNTAWIARPTSEHCGCQRKTRTRSEKERVDFGKCREQTPVAKYRRQNFDGILTNLYFLLQNT